MDLKRKQIPEEAIKNLEKSLLNSDYPYRRVLLDVGDLYYIGIELDMGKSMRKLMAVPYPIDPTSDDFYKDMRNLDVVKLDRDMVLTAKYRLDEDGKPVPMKIEDELYLDSIESP